MESKGYQLVNLVRKSGSKKILKQLDQIEQQHPEFYAAFSLISLNICADAMSDKNAARGNLLTDLGADISTLVLKGAQHAIPNKALARSIAEKVNVSLEMKAIKNYLNKQESDTFSQINVTGV